MNIKNNIQFEDEFKAWLDTFTFENLVEGWNLPSILRHHQSDLRNTLRVKSVAKAEKAKLRREVNAKRADDWASEYLKPGMVVTVSGCSTKYRLVEHVYKGVFTGRHVHFKGNKETSKYDMIMGDYITDHYTRKISGVAIVNCNRNLIRHIRMKDLPDYQKELEV